MKLNHSTDLATFFSIWKDGWLRPQEYNGGDSSAKKGEKVLFCFADDRFLMGGFVDVVIFLPVGTPFSSGVYITIDADEDMLVKEPEYHVHLDIPIDKCKIVVQCKIPTLDDFSWESDDPDSYEDEWREEASSFLAFCSQNKGRV